MNSIFTYNLNFTYVDGLLAWNSQRLGKPQYAERRVLGLVKLDSGAPPGGGSPTV